MRYPDGTVLLCPDGECGGAACVRCTPLAQRPENQWPPDTEANGWNECNLCGRADCRCGDTSRWYPRHQCRQALAAFGEALAIVGSAIPSLTEQRDRLQRDVHDELAKMRLRIHLAVEMPNSATRAAQARAGDYREAARRLKRYLAHELKMGDAAIISINGWVERAHFLEAERDEARADVERLRVALDGVRRMARAALEDD